MIDSSGNTEANSGWEIIGVPASPGIAIGRAFILPKKSAIESRGPSLENEADIAEEIRKFTKAVWQAVNEIEEVKKKRKLNNSELDILEAHIELLTDPQLHDDVLQIIRTQRRNAAGAVADVIIKFVQVFNNMTDEYMRARSADVRDIGDRILRNLQNDNNKANEIFQFNTVLIAEEISPSDAITIDMTRVIAFVTRVGGRTSHTAILAKSKHLPAVLGCGETLDKIKNDDVIVVDGAAGIVIVNPDNVTFEEYAAKFRRYQQDNDFTQSSENMMCETMDKVRITLMANISNGDELVNALKYGASGAGLLRTELLFMNRKSFPTEEEQFQFYSNIALKSQGKPVIVRTIDIGGDKPVSYFNLPKEDNPFLGYRAIRISLDRKDLFVTQLKAILRASTMRNLRIMFPMISSLQELQQAKLMLEETKLELRKRNRDFDENIPVGMMIEVPSAAVLADIFAKEVDFFSIGTNDLCQYTLAVDRGNEKIKDLYDPYNPAVLRLISNAIEQGNKHNIAVGMCGEFASDPLATMLLVGMGLKDFSMSAVSIPSVREQIRKISYEKAQDVFKEVMSMSNSKSIVDYLTGLSKK